ncbi:MAG: biopolymer transporter ExbD [Phycisphaera sp.]|nr:biopolymer transporter ExbD [Phycisphaera sp.]
MFKSMRKSRKNDSRSAATVNLAPLIDMVFILLIFFLVTTTFIKDTGVEVTRATAAAATPLAPDALRISIARSGAIYTEGDRVDLDTLEQSVRRFLSDRPHGAVIVIADKDAPSGGVVDVMDAAKRAGAAHVSLAADLPTNR